MTVNYGPPGTDRIHPSQYDGRVLYVGLDHCPGPLSEFSS
jgi:hypothetical protein